MLAVGTTLIDRYRITGYIHKGGMGAVYHAHDQLDNIVVAVKQSFYADENFLREQFRREAALLRRLDHPALPKVHNYFAEGGGQFLVMDFVEGEDLEHLLHGNQGPLPLKQVLEWADRILDALDYLHRNKPAIIHRDIKPANLKLTPAGDILLLDFGLAKNETTPTLPGRSIAAATPEYAPPEQINGEGTDPRSDLFSFGATLYHLLTNQAPISAGIRDGVVKQGARDPLRLAGEINPLIPPAISGVIHKAMAIARDQRYVSGAAMRIALREATGVGSATVIDPPPPQLWERRPTQPRRPTVAPPPTPQPTAEPSADWEKAPMPAPVRLRKPLLIGVAASLVVLALLGYWLLSGQPSAPVLVSMSFTTARVDRYGNVTKIPDQTVSGFVEDLGNGVKLDMVKVPGGAFDMGSPSDERDRGDDEVLRREVRVNGFFIGGFEVTQAQWQAVMGDNLNPRFKGANLPMEQVSWDDAMEFCRRLSRRTGREYRLPTEAEWEYAARASARTPLAFGETITPEIVNYDGNNPYGNAPKGEYRQRTIPVGSLGVANAFGLFDMHGNVWEWCEDWYAPYDPNQLDNPKGSASGSNRVLRGGSWGNVGRYCRSAYRLNHAPSYRSNYIGFRVVCVSAMRATASENKPGSRRLVGLNDSNAGAIHPSLDEETTGTPHPYFPLLHFPVGKTEIGKCMGGK